MSVAMYQKPCERCRCRPATSTLSLYGKRWGVWEVIVFELCRACSKKRAAQVDRRRVK